MSGVQLQESDIAKWRHRDKVTRDKVASRQGVKAM